MREEVGGAKRKAADAIKAKRDSYLNTPNVSFHFAEKNQIKSFYNDYFREPETESRISKIITEASGGVKGSIPQVLESRLGGKDIREWISTIKLPETSINGMFLRFQRETIRNGQVTLGLEVVDIELSDLERFQSLINDLLSKYSLMIDSQAILEREAALKEKAAQRTLVKLKAARGPPLVEGNFQIADAGNDYYKYTYRHPVSDYILESQKTVTMSFLLHKPSIEPQVAGNYFQSMGRTIPIRVYGNVCQPIDPDADV